MVRLDSLIKGALFCLALPLAAQVPPFVDGPVFGNSRLFSDGLLPSGSTMQSPSETGFFALGFAQGDQGGNKFLSCLDDFYGGDTNKINNAIMDIKDARWGMRSRAYGLALCDQNSTISFTREEMTSLWADVIGSDTVGFDVRRSVVERFAFVSIASNNSNKVFCGGTLRVERWSLGGEYQELGTLSLDTHISQARSLLDYKDAPNRSITYGIDVFTGLEIASGLRLVVQTNRIASRRFGDVKENPQVRAGVQIDLGMTAKINLESDINETMRMPFPVMQKTAVASLKIKANSTITFAVGAERKTLDGQQTTTIGLNAWLTGKTHWLGLGFQFGQNQAPWGTTWKIY